LTFGTFYDIIDLSMKGETMWINIKGRVVNFNLVEYYEYVGMDLYLYFGDGESMKFGKMENEDFERLNRILQSIEVGGWK
jgi:hypothetical protein